MVIKNGNKTKNKKVVDDYNKGKIKFRIKIWLS